MCGNEGILTYVNQTSQGMSGGAVIQHKDYLDNAVFQPNKRSLVGIHVSGHLHQSKCTLLVKTNLDWISSIFEPNANKNVYKSLPWQDRVLLFFEKIQNFPDDKTTLLIDDLDIFPVTSKMISLVPKSKLIETIIINLKLNTIVNDQEKIQNRIQCLINMVKENLNVKTLDMENSKFDKNSLSIFFYQLNESGKNDQLTSLSFEECELDNDCYFIFIKYLPELHNLKILNLSSNLLLECVDFFHILQLTNIDNLYLAFVQLTRESHSTLMEVLPNTQIKRLFLSASKFIIDDNIQNLANTKLIELDIGCNKLNVNHLKKLLNVLPNTTIKKLNFGKNYITEFPKNIHKLTETQICDLNIDSNGEYLIKNEEWKKLLSILPLTKIGIFNLGKQSLLPKDVETKIKEIVFNNLLEHLPDLDENQKFLNLRKKKFNSEKLYKLFQNLPETNINNLNLRWCGLRTFPENLNNLQKTKIKLLNLGYNYINDDEFFKLLEILPKTKISKLGLDGNEIMTFPKNINNLIHTQIEILALSTNADENSTKIKEEEWEKLLPILPLTKIKTIYLGNQITIPEDIKIKIMEIVTNNNSSCSIKTARR